MRFFRQKAQMGGFMRRKILMSHIENHAVPIRRVLVIGLFFLRGCTAESVQPLPRYEGSSDYTGSHGIRAFGADVKEDVLAYIAKYGKNGWVSGLTDSRNLPGECWEAGGPTNVRVKDLFYAVYQCQFHGDDAVILPTHFDLAEHDTMILELLRTNFKDAKRAAN